MRRSLLYAATLFATSMLVLVTGCLTGRPRTQSTPAPTPCTYRVSRTSDVASMSTTDSRYRAVITATVGDSTGKPLASASVARLAGPGSFSNADGKAVIPFSERDLERAGDIVVRRIGFGALHIPVRIAPGDSVDIVASMCPTRHWLEENTTWPPEHDHSGLGAAIGAIAGAVLGYQYARGSCDLIASQCNATPAAIGGAAIGALIGYGIGDIFKSRSACMPADGRSVGMSASLRELLSADDTADRKLRERAGIPTIQQPQVSAVTDERVCQRAREVLDSTARASNPAARGMRKVPSVYVVRGGGLVSVQTPGSSATYIFDAGTWKRLFVFVVPD